MQSFFMQYMITYCATTILCAFLMIYMAVKMDRDVGNFIEIRIFRSMIAMELIVVFVETIWRLLLLTGFKFDQYAYWFLNYLDMIGSIGALYYMMRFVEARLNPAFKHDNYKQKRWSQALVILWLVGIAVNIFSYWTHWTYYITPDSLYHRGPYYFIQVLCCYFYPIITFGMISYWAIHDRVRHKHSMQLLIFLLFPFLGWLPQVFISIAPFSVMSTMLGLFYLFSSIQSDRINTDALTGLNNRNRSRDYLESRLKNADNRPFYLAICDVNEFKKINDTYGHVNGDHALIAIANTFKEFGSTHHGFFASRYGGDEFLMAVDAQNVTPTLLRNTFNEALAEQIIKEDLGFDLTVCFGFAYCKTAQEPLMDLISKADQALYEDKKRKKDHKK